MGRMFDAAAGLLGIKAVMAYEGQAAMLMEGLAQCYGDILPLDQGWRIEQGRLDLLPLLAVLADERNAERGAALFHATLAAAIADWLRVLAPDEKRWSAAAAVSSTRCSCVPCAPPRRARNQTHRSAPGATQRWWPRCRSGLDRPAASAGPLEERCDMCLALPCRIVELRPDERALIDVAGVGKEISLALVEDVAVGDYVIVHVGYALTRLDPEEAEKTLVLFAELGEAALQEAGVAGEAIR
jgi:hydrogenase expression/formation protein HypC